MLCDMITGLGSNKFLGKRNGNMYDNEETGLIDDYIGELNIGLGKCLVISEDIASSTWVSVNNTGGYLVVVNYLSDFYINEGLKCEILYNEFRKIAEDQFVDTGIIYFEMFLKRLELLRNIS